jgi:4-amino-4-deoxy-L-arabinose transferase-like glycosyltransferase
VKNKKEIITLVLILLFSLFIRLIWLSSFPTGITNDELHFVLNAKSIILNFSNLANNWNPLSLKTIPGETSSELSFLLLSPIVGWLPLNLFTARLPGAIFGTLTVLVLYLLVKKITNPAIAVFVSFLAAINPWFVYFSRTAFDAPLAVFFILLSIYLLISDKKILLITFSVIFAFYSYIGTKILIFPFIFITSAFIYFTGNHQALKKLILINVFTLALSLNYGFTLLNHESGNRTGEIISFSDPKIVLDVNQGRQFSQSPGIFKLIFNNKILTTANFSFSKLLNSFSPNLLFLKGDETFTGSLWKQGYFYSIEFFTIILGLVFLFLKYRPVFWLLVSLLILSPLPETIRKDIIPAYALHAAFQYPLLTILSGTGLYYLFSLKNKYFKYLLVLIILFNFLRFFNLYFFEYPYYASDSFSLKNRVLSYYLLNEIKNNPITVLCKEPDALFKNYIFYTDSLRKNTFNNISSAYSNRSENRFTYDHLTLTSNEKDLENLVPGSVVIIEEGINASFNSTSKLIFSNLDRSLTLFSIYNGQTCSKITPSTAIASLYNLNYQPANFCPGFFTPVSF